MTEFEQSCEVFDGLAFEDELRVAGQMFSCLESDCSSAMQVDVFLDGYHLNLSYYSDEKGVRAAALEDLLLCGATIRLRQVQQNFSAWRAFCSEVSSVLGQDVWLNAYFSQVGSSGLGRHQDPHHVFALQCFGQKRWSLSSSELSEPHHTILADSSCLLYVPKGLWHQVSNCSLLSVHLAIGCKSDLSAEQRSYVFGRMEEAKRAMQSESFADEMLEKTPKISSSLKLSSNYGKATFLERIRDGSASKLDKRLFVTDRAYEAATHVLNLLQSERLPKSVINDGVPRTLHLQVLLGLENAGLLKLTPTEGGWQAPE
ncbi:MAG: cupin domain-containing protein [Pseudomonadota bacterium]